MISQTVISLLRCFFLWLSYSLRKLKSVKVHQFVLKHEKRNCDGGKLLKFQLALLARTGTDATAVMQPMNTVLPKYFDIQRPSAQNSAQLQLSCWGKRTRHDNNVGGASLERATTVHMVTWLDLPIQRWYKREERRFRRGLQRGIQLIFWLGGIQITEVILNYGADMFL